MPVKRVEEFTKVQPETVVKEFQPEIFWKIVADRIRWNWLIVWAEQCEWNPQWNICLFVFACELASDFLSSANLD